MKEAVAVMGKLKDDMIFLEKIANSKTLSTNLLDTKYLKKTRGSRMKILNAAEDGLSFLKVRGAQISLNFYSFTTSPNETTKRVSAHRPKKNSST